MELLLYNFLLILGLVINKIFKNKNYIFLYLFFLYAFRFNSGPDFYQYKKIFEGILSYKISFMNEPGYILLNRIIKNLNMNYSIFLIIHTIIFLLPIYLTLKQIENKKAKEIFVELYLMLPMLFFEQFTLYRQGVSCGFFLWSITDIINRDLKRYSCKIFIAFLFHKSSILLLPIYFLYPFLNKRKYILYLFLSILLGFKIVINQVLNLFPKYSQYMDHNSQLGYGFLINLPLLLFLVIFFREVSIKNRRIVGLYILYLGFPIIKTIVGLPMLVRFEQYLVNISLFGFLIIYKEFKVIRRNYKAIFIIFILFYNFAAIKKLNSALKWTRSYRNSLFLSSQHEERYFEKWKLEFEE